MLKIVKFLIIAAFATASYGCQEVDRMDAEGPAKAPVTYDCLYNCLWMLTDSADDTGEIPSFFGREGTALYFYEKSGVMCLLRRRPDLEEDTGKEPVYSVVEEGSYSIDYETRTVTISTTQAECDFQIERLNDRTLTLYYRTDPNAYVAYTRSGFTSVTVMK